MKNFIEKTLQENCSILDLNKWFKPLTMHYDEQNAHLTVLFPHAFFEPWFAEQGKNVFEQTVKSVGLQKFGRIPNIEYTISNPYKIKSINNTNKLNEKLENKKSENQNFSNFFYNKKNELTLAVTQEIINNITTCKYNPFTIYGKSSTGKTHILNSIYEELLKKNINIFLGSIKDLCLNINSLNIKNFIKSYSIFLIDDFQNIESMIEFQQLLTTFIDLCIAENKQIIMINTAHPATQKKYTEALRSRLSIGLVTKLDKPDIDVRMRFILSFCQEQDVKISKNQLLLIAQRCSNISILRGIILKIKAFKELSQKKLDDFDLEEILFSLSDKKKSISHKDIISFTSKHFNIDRKKILENARQSQVVKARQIAMYLCRDLLGLSYPNIGKIFAGKDHSTVMYSIKKIKISIDTHKDIQDAVTKIKEKCLSV